MAEDAVEPLITECPGCHTRFRVTEAQLAKANGRVRCGACLHVFRAADHLVLSLDADPPDVDPDTALDALLNELSEATAARELRTSEPAPVPRVVRERARGERPPPMPTSATPSVGLPALPGRPPAPPARPPASTVRPSVPQVTIMRGVPRTPPPLPQSIVPDPVLWKTPVADNPATPVPNDPVEVRDPFQEPAAVPQPSELRSSAEGLARAAPGRSWDTRPVQADDTNADVEPLEVAATAAAPVVTTADNVSAHAAIDAEDQTPQEVEEIELAERPAAPPPSAGSARPRRDHTHLALDPLGLGDAPYPVDVALPPRKRWWLIAGIPVALVVLFGQVLWFQFATWSRDPQIRPVYEWLCAPLGCELPVMRAVDQFRTKNLVVRSHPEKSGMLQVDAIIVNDAPFAQPFPQIELRFSAIGGNLVAARRFEPKEYLAGEAKGSSQIGARTPVHIALEIPDPGADAVNYVIAFQ